MITKDRLRTLFEILLLLLGTGAALVAMSLAIYYVGWPGIFILIGWLAFAMGKTRKRLWRRTSGIFFGEGSSSH